MPALVLVLGQDPHTATTGSLLIVGTTALLALVPHSRAGRVRVGQGLLFGALGTGGSIAGSALAAHVDADVLLAAFAVLITVVAVLMLLRSRGGDAGSLPASDLTAEPMLTVRPFACACPRVLRLVVTASVVGLLTGFFGVGGGFVLVPALVLALGFPMPVAVGTSLLVIAVNSATALAARVGSGMAGDLDWRLIGVFTVAAVSGSLVGGRVVSRVDPRLLTRVFALLLLLVAASTAARSIPALS